MSMFNDNFFTYPVDYENAALVFDEKNELWANCKFIMKTGEIYGIELNESNVNFSLDSAFLWRTNGNRMKVELKGINPFAFELLQAQ